MIEQPLLTLAEKIDLLFRQVRKPNGRRYTYEDVPGFSTSTVSRLRRGEQTEPSFWGMVSMARTFDVPMTYFSDELTQEDAEALLDFLAGRPRRLREEAQLQMETAETLALLAVRSTQLSPDQIVQLHAWLGEVLSDLDLSVGK